MEHIMMVLVAAQLEVLELLTLVVVAVELGTIIVTKVVLEDLVLLFLEQSPLLQVLI